MTEPMTAPPEERDPWLAEALRHAPDAADAAPPALREAILAEARGATSASDRRDAREPHGARGARGPTFGARVAAWWAALARPPVAAGFATVMVAVLVGVLWHGQPMDESLLPPPPMRDAAAPRPGAEPAPAAAAAPAAATPAEVPTTTAPTAKKPAPAPTSATTPAPARAALQAQPFPADEPRASPLKAERADAPARERRAVEAEIDAGSSLREKQVDAAMTRRRADAEDSVAADRSAAAPRPAGATAPPAAPVVAAPEAPRAAPRGEVTEAKSRAVAGAPGGVARPMAPLLRALAAPDARWTRAGGAGPESAVDTSFVDWLGSVDAAVAGRWQRGSPPSDASGGGATAVELRRDGRATATLRIGDDALVFRDAEGRDWFAPLGAGAAAPLRSALPPSR